MLATKFDVALPNGDVFHAGSRTGIIKRLQSENQYWTEQLSRCRAELPKRGATLRYDLVISELEAHDWKEPFPLSDFLPQGGETGLAPPKDSVAGIALAQLIERGPNDAVVGFICAYFSENRWTTYNPDDSGAGGRRYSVGLGLLWSARFTSAATRQSQYSAAMEAQVERVKRQADEQDVLLDALAQSAEGAQSELSSWRDRLGKRHKAAKRLALSLAEKSSRSAVSVEKERSERWENAYQTYVTQLQLRAPVIMWTNAARRHRGNSRLALALFLVLIAVLSVALGYVAIGLGDSVAAAFVPKECLGIPGCVGGISPKGPLVLGTILVVSSMAIWVARLSHKVFLSERHLALDADERRAFTEAYLSLVMDQSVSREQEAIVLAALFRTSSDGIIKDDEGGVDLSAAVLLSRAMAGKSTPT